MSADVRGHRRPYAEAHQRARSALRRWLEAESVRRYRRTMPMRGNPADAIRASEGRLAHLAVVTFNQPRLLEWQIEALTTHFEDSFALVVADNSDDVRAAGRIEELCRARGVTYLALPPRPRLLSHGGSGSHGLALSWLHTNGLRHSHAEYVGLLDHDIFPIAPVSYRQLISRQGSYGHVQRYGDVIFYWPGLHFFHTRFFDDHGADFSPGMFSGTYADTGASNWPTYYSRLELADLDTFTLEDVRADDPSAAYVKDGDLPRFCREALTLFDRTWVHLVNGSNWAGVDMEVKLQSLEELLTQDR